MVRRLVFVLLIVLGVAGFIAIPVAVGVERTLTAIRGVGVLCVVAYLANFSLVLIAPGISWWILLRSGGLRINLVDVLRANFFGFPINLLTPSAWVGAEPVKAYYLCRKYNLSPTGVVGTMVVAKFQEATGLFLLMMMSAAGLVFYSDLVSARAETTILAALGITLVLFTLFLVSYAKNFKPLTRMSLLLARAGFLRTRLAPILLRIRSTEQVIHDTLVPRWKSFLLAQAVALISTASVFFRLPLFMAFTPDADRLRWIHVFAVFLATNVINTLQFIPGSLGVLDGVLLLVFDQTGLSETHAAAYNIVNRIADVTLFTVGIWLLIHLGLARYLRRHEKAELRRQQTGMLRDEERPRRRMHGPLQIPEQGGPGADQ